MRHPFGLRWFGIYVLFVVVGTTLGWLLGDRIGFGVLAAQVLYVAIFIGGDRIDRRVGNWLVRPWL